MLLLLSRFSGVQLLVTPWTAGSSIHGISQARVLEWGAIAFSVLMIRRIQIKTTMSYHFTLARTIIIKKSKDSKFCKGCGGIKSPLYTFSSNANWYKILWKTVWNFSQQLNAILRYDLAIPFLGISKIIEIRILESYLYSHAHCSTTHNSQAMETKQTKKMGAEGEGGKKQNEENI